MNPTPKSWRELVEVHPAADLFPMMSDDELLLLGKDMAKNGLREQIALLAADLDGSKEANPSKPVLLDGRNRLAAIDLVVQDVGERDKLIEAMLAGAERLDGSIDPFGYVASKNLRRRHLTMKQKSEIAAKLLKQNPERSDLATAKLAGLSDKKVTGLRTDLEARSEIPNVKHHVDTAGRRQPARKAPKAGARATGTTKAQQRDNAVVAFLKAFRAKPFSTLEDLLTMLKDEQKCIAAIPTEKRLMLREGFSKVLGAGTTSAGAAASAVPVSVAPGAGCAASAVTGTSPSSVAPEKRLRHRLSDSNDNDRQT